jgi:Bromodomain extra-terminal - transcription regulation
MMMEAQIQSLHSALSALKKKPKKDKKNKAYSVPKPPKAPRPATSSSFGGAPKKKKKQSHDDDEVLTFEQKKALSESIQTLDGAKLEKVLEIIDEVYPEIREVCTPCLSCSNRHQLCAVVL